MKRICKVIAVLLVAAVLFTGCNPAAFRQWVQGMLGQSYVPFSQMEYQRPDMGEFRDQLQVCIQGAGADTKIDTLMEKVYDFYDIYYRFQTNYKLANIYYYKDLTDVYWADEYTYCLENSSEITAGMDQLLYALAKSSLKSQLEADEYFGAGYFDAYTGQSLWDETFTALMTQEMKLQNEYDALSAKALEYPYHSDAFYEEIGVKMEELLVQLVLIRQKIAKQAGYEDYLQFAYDYYYDRDYTPAQAMAYLDDVRTELSELYVELPVSAWDAMDEKWTEDRMFAYAESMANNMGGLTANAFAVLKEGGYYDITYSPNKYNASYETYLEYYYVPFIFVNPRGDGSDPLTFVHEFGHFCNDYASTGTLCSIDVAEVFSQGMEYLSLYYADGGEQFEKMVLANSLSIFVEQAIYSNFEHQLYRMEDPTVEKVRALYLDIAEDYGLGTMSVDSQEYVSIAHLYIAPVYMLSYVLSNDVAMQIYQAEEAASGAGKQLLENNLDTKAVTLMAFVGAAGLTDPFVEGRVAQLRETFEKVFG